jgi:hypothetical protein
VSLRIGGVVPSVLYSPDDFKAKTVLVKESLYETIYRLEEAYWGLREFNVSDALRTFTWIRTRVRYGRDDVLAKTEYDRSRTRTPPDPRTGKGSREIYLKSLTGEQGWKRSMVLVCSVLKYPKLVPNLTEGLRENFMLNDPGPKGRRYGRGSEGILARGMYCCQVCTPQYQRALSHAAPALYRKQESKFMRHLKEWRERGGGTRWYRMPFYLTVLALHDIGSKAAKKELTAVARNYRGDPRKKWTGDDRSSRAKAKAADILMSYR